MEDKKYGVKTHLVNEFKQFQISRREQNIPKMPVFLGNGTLYINANGIRCRIEAGNGILSLIPFPLFPGGLIGFRVPSQTLERVHQFMLIIKLHSSLKVTLIFDTPEEQEEFTTKLNVRSEDSSADEGIISSDSAPSPIPSTDSGVL